MRWCFAVMLFLCLTPLTVLAQTPAGTSTPLGTPPGSLGTVPGQPGLPPGQPPAGPGPYQNFPGSPLAPTGQTAAPPAGLPFGQPGPGDAPGPEWLTVKNLKEGDRLITKKPEFEGEIILAIKPGSLVIMVDYVDVTALAEVSGNRISFRAPMVMPAGTHSLMLTAQDAQGQPLQKMISFTTRHTVHFEEAASVNEVTGLYEALLAKTDTTSASQYGSTGGTSSLPYSKVEGNWSTDNRVREGAWDLGFKGNLRYLDQSAPVVYPLEIGVYPANYLLSGKYRRETHGFGLDIGDVLLNESPYTAQYLARRGGLFSANYQGLDLRAFSVLSKQLYGFYDGLGIHPTTDDHINGASAGYKLLNNRMEFRAIYLKGGETPASYGTITSPSATVIPAAPGTTAVGTAPGVTPGISTVTGVGTNLTPSPYGLGTTLGRKEGEVAGFLFLTDFFQNKLKSEMEVDFSRFDPNAADLSKAKEDKAWRVKLGGLYDKFTYEALCEYIGRDYEVIGSWIQKDKQGVTLRGGAAYPTQSVNLTFSRYNDNVTGDALYPRLVTYQGLVDYNYTGWPTLPINLNFSKTLQDPYDIPAGLTAPQSDTNTVGGRISYMSLPWNIGFQTSYSRQDDKSPLNNDSTIRILTLMPMLTYPTFGLSFSLSLNQTEYELANYRNDNFLFNLQLTGKLFNNRFSYELGNTYTIMKATNNSYDSRMLTGNFRLGYALGRFFNGAFNPTVGLRGQYNHLVDNVNSSMARDDFALFLFVSTSMPFSF